MFQLEQRHLSEEADRNATNPYPIYSIVERELKSQEPKKGTLDHVTVDTEPQRDETSNIDDNLRQSPLGSDSLIL